MTVFSKYLGVILGSSTFRIVGQQKFRNWVTAFLLFPMLSMSAASYAGDIHHAAKSGNLEEVQRLTIQGSDVNEKGLNGETPLVIASLAGHGEVANYLLQRGANIDTPNTAGLSPLHAAAYGGYTDIVSLLIAKGAKVNDAENRFGVTPLHLVAEENHVATAELLLKHGADVNALEVNGYSVLSRAGFREHWDVVNLLLANGAVWQEADKVGEWLHKECSTRASAN